MFPAVGNDRVGDELHGPEFLVDVFDERRVPEEHGGAVVVVVRVGCEGKHYAVDFAGRDADAHAFACGGGAGEVHDSRGDVAVEVAV